MKKRFHRVLALFLAAVTAFGVLPIIPLSVIGADTEVEEHIYTYDEMYVQDGLAFSWNGFALTEEGGAVSTLENRKEGKNITVDGTAQNGYLYTKSTLDFTPFLSSSTADDGAILLSDTTLELVLLQVDGVSEEGAETRGTYALPHVTNSQINAFNITDKANKRPIDTSYGFISESYGVLTPLTGTANIQMATDVAWKPIKVFGNTQGESYAIDIVSDYTVTDTAKSTGTLDVYYYRDSVKTVAYNALYDAHYVGNFKAVDDAGNPKTPTAATSSYLKLRFGGLGFGYQAIRVYNRALTSDEIKQNHAADLFAYYGIDLQEFMAMPELARQKSINDLSSHIIGKTSKTAIKEVFAQSMQAAEQVKYDELYASEGLIFSWQGWSLTAKDGQIAYLDNASGSKGISLTGTAGNGYLYSKGVLDFTDLIPYDQADDGARQLSDTTLEIVMKQIDDAPAKGVTNKGTYSLPHASLTNITSRNIPDNKNQQPIDASYGFISESYGVLTPQVGNANLQMPTDVAHTPTKVFGNTQGATYAVSIRSDYTITDSYLSTGTMQVAYFRDGAQATCYDAAYDAHYVGNFKAVDTNGEPVTPTKATTSNLKLRFGGLGFGYQAIRLYSRALSNEEIMQNHAADLFSYYQIDLDKYTALEDEDRLEALELLTAYKIGETTKEAIEEVFVTVTLPTLDEIYGHLYVQDGLIFRWDGFELEANGLSLTELPNFLEGGKPIDRRTSGREKKNIELDGRGASMSGLYAYDRSALYTTSSQLMLTDLIPYYEKDGTNLPTDMTLEVSASYPSTYKTSPVATETVTTTGYNGGVLYLGPLSTVGFSKVNNNQPYGAGAMINSITNPIECWYDDFSSFDKGGVSYVGNFPDKVFYNALNLDYDEEATDFEKIPYSFTIGRDGSYVYTRSGKYYSITTDYSPYDGEATLMQLTYGTTVATQYYSIRLYSRTLTEAEMKQNHTVDLLKYYRVDIDLFNVLDWKATEKLYESLSDYQIGETSKEELENILVNFALTGGALGVVDVNDYIKFVGVQARIEDYAAMRVRYSFALDKIELLNKMGADLSFGVLYGRKADLASAESMTLDFNRSINEFVLTEPNATNHTVYYRGEWSESADYLVMQNGMADFGIKLPSVACDDADFAEKTAEEYYVRAYMAVSIDGSPFVVYLDLDTEEFGKTLSINAVNEFFVCNGYASSSILALTTDEEIRTASQVSETLYLELREKYERLQTLLNTLNGANRGAGVSSGNYAKVENTAAVDMELALAMQMGALSATSRAELLIYIELGLEAYNEALNALAELQKADAERASLVLSALDGYDLSEEARLALAEKVTKNAQSMRANAEAAMTDAATMATNLEGSQKTLETSYAQNKISKVLSPISSLFLAGTSVTRYTIVTTSKYLEAAEQLQRSFLANQGAFVGIYQIDNPYIGGIYEPTGENLIYIGMTDAHLSDGLFSVYMNGKNLCLEGDSVAALNAAVTAFTRTYTSGTGRIRLDETSIGDTLLLRSYTPMIVTNIPETYGKITVSSYDANGVWEAFKQTIDNKPDEITVMDKKNPDDFSYSKTLEIIVSPDGSDETGDGTLENPYATLDFALTKLAYRDGGIIKLRGGTYSLTKSVSITDAHKGTKTSPLIITSYEGETVSFTSGKTIAGSKFVKASEADFLTDTEKSRLEKFTPGNTENVYVVNLAQNGFSSLSSYVNDSSQPKVYVSGTSYTVSRFPNAGEENEAMRIYDGRIRTTFGQKDIKNCGNVSAGISSLYYEHRYDATTWEIWLDDGDDDATNNVSYRDRVLSYDLSTDKLWTSASLYEEWDTKTYNVTVKEAADGRKYLQSATASAYGAKHAADNGLYFFNMLEDLDAEGEYLINPSRMILYIYAPDGLADEEITVSSSTFPPIMLKKAENVLINGITVENSNGVGIFASESTNVLIQDCTFRNLSSNGVTLDTCFNSGVTYSKFYTCGNLLLSSSLTGQLIPNRCFVQNNRFENATSTASLGVRVGGVANVISHNYFYETTMSHAHNLETVIEYNEFVRGSQIVRDNGPIYTGYISRGMVIRYNLLRDLNYSGYGIYVDDMGSEHYVYGNIVHYGEDAAKGGKCINLHNGNMNVVWNNICISATTNAIQNNLNYYPKTIDGVSTKVGGLGYRWESIARDRLLGYYNFYIKEKLDDRYPMYAWFSAIVARSIQTMDENPAWEPLHKITPRDDDEIFTRTPVFNIYKNNLTYDCAAPLYVPPAGQETCIISGNLDYSASVDVGFVDFENGNYQIKEDSILFDEIDGFFAPPFEKMGLTE